MAGIAAAMASTALSSSHSEASPSRLGPAPSFPFVYQGNPNVIVSSVDVNTNGIVAPRTSGAWPLFIQVSASGILCTGTNANGNPVLPYEDLMYVWTDGQGSNADTVVNPTNNLGINVSTGTQFGPEATFCYRKPGKYLLTLTIHYQTALGVYSSLTKTLPISVEAFAGSVRYLDTNLTTGANDGSSPANAWQSNNVAAAKAFMVGGANRKLLIACGSRINAAPGTVAFVILEQNGRANGARIDSYVPRNGVTAKPIFGALGPVPANEPCILLIGGPYGSYKPVSDAVISNIDVRHDNPACNASMLVGCILGGSAGNQLNSSWNYVCLDNCDFTNLQPNKAACSNFSTSGVVPTGGRGTHQGWTIWKCNFYSPIFNDTKFGNSVHGIFGGPTKWFSVLGSSFSGSGSDPSRGGAHHHIYPETVDHSLYRWNSFGQTGSGKYFRNYCINFNLQGNLGQYHLLADSLLGPHTLTADPTTGLIGNYMKNGHDASDVNNNPLDGGGAVFRNFVVERNFAANLYEAFAQPGNLSSYTNRFNNYYNSGGFIPVPSLAGILAAQFYKNNFMIDSTGRVPSIPTLYQVNNQGGKVTANVASPCTFTTGGTQWVPGTKVNLPYAIGGVPAGDYWVAVNTGAAIQLTTVKGTPANVNNTSSPGSGAMNIVWDDFASLTQTDNVFVSKANGPTFVNLPNFAQFAVHALINRNQYFWSKAPSGNVFTDQSVSTSPNTSVSAWQRLGFDRIVSFTAPSWRDPAKGIF